MSFLSKVELKKQLQEMGIKVEGNYVRKKDINKILASMGKNENFLVTSVNWLKKSINGDKQKILKVLSDLADRLSEQGLNEKEPSVIEAFDTLEHLLGSLKDPMFAKPVRVLLALLKKTN